MFSALESRDVGAQLGDARARVLQLRQTAIAEEERDREDDGQHAGEQDHGLERDVRRATGIVNGDRGCIRCVVSGHARTCQARSCSTRRFECGSRAAALRCSCSLRGQTERQLSLPHSKRFAPHNSPVKHDQASNPLTERYASREMSYLFSPNFKFRTWRRLWIALAEAEQELGLPITRRADRGAEGERGDDQLRGRGAARARGAPRRDGARPRVRPPGAGAKGIIHLGATSAYVTDNTDILQMAEGLRILQRRLVNLMAKLRDFAWKWRATPTLAFTHFQPAQLTTVGKRATLWLHDLLLDYRELEFRQSQLALLGVKGATGTQASFLNLFGGDEAKVQRLEQLVAEKVGMRRSYPVSGQTYSRKVDAQVVNALSGFAQSASKFGYDMRLLQHLREIEEPFEEEQIGSSAMPYKRNPMRAERIDALARHLIVNTLNPALTAATQWFERTLDDSANRRIAIPEAFLAADAIALIYDNIAGGLRRARGRDRVERASRAAVPHDREPDDGRREPRRRPAGAARAHPHSCARRPRMR